MTRIDSERLSHYFPLHWFVHARTHVLFCSMLLATLLMAATNTVWAQEMIVLRPATQNEEYEEKIATEGTAPYTWTVLEGALPPGLRLEKDGSLRGTPTSSSTTPSRFKVRVTDSSPSPRTSEQWLSLAVRPPVSLIGVKGEKVAAPTPTPSPTPAPTPFILTSSTDDEETIAVARRFGADPSQPTPKPDTDQENIKILRSIIGTTVGVNRTTTPKPGPNEFELGDYLVMHTIVWRALVDNKSEPEREISALFKAVRNPEDPKTIVWEPVIDKANEDIFGARIMGSKRVAVLLVHLNTPTAWDIKYTVTINRKIPTPIQHAIELASAVLGAGAKEAAASKNVWGARMMLVRYESSELVVKLNAISPGAGGKSAEQNKENSKTLVNEGKYHWDVSVGLPVKSVRELSFKSEGNQVVAESKEKQSVYGFLNLYPWAVDLKSNDFFTRPHLVIGVPLASKPLQRPFLGAGIGVFKTPIKFNVFAGIVFNRQRVPRTLAEGATATTGQLEADMTTRWVRKFMFGINLPVSQIKDAIKK